MSRILITGSENGLGLCLKSVLNDAGHDARGYDLSHGNDVRKPSSTHVADVMNGHHLDVLINNAGVNLIDWLEDISEQDWDTVMSTNAKGIMMMTQACLPALIHSGGTVVNIVSNAAHMPMTCSLAYNASKAAAHIMTQQLARELTPKYGITVFGVAPNKLKGTGMSRDIEEQVVKTRGWSAEFAAEYQRKALLTGEETPPMLVADFIAFLLKDKINHMYLSGCVLPYGA